MSYTAFSLNGKRALVTGGGTGIGLAISRGFIEAGAEVIILGRRESVLRAAVANLGPAATFVIFDISHLDRIPDLAKDLEAKHGPIDILVNNAGKHVKKMAQDTTDQDFADVFKVNVLSVFAMTRAFAGFMIKRNGGCILMVSSMTAFFGVDKVVAYGTSKSALTGLINCLVTEYSTNNVRVNAIAPGWIETDIFKTAVSADPERREKIERRIAMNGFGLPEDIGHAAVFLCSDAARYITGVVLPVDGGAAVNM